MSVLQEWIPNNKSTFKKFRDWINQVVSIINTQENTMTNKTEVIFGTYTGDGTASRFINLGFTPVAVEVYTHNGKQAGATGGLNNSYFGGLALNGYPCRNVIEVVENGFNVFYNQDYNQETESLSNLEGMVYYFKAYKPSSYEIVNIT